MKKKGYDVGRVKISPRVLEEVVKSAKIKAIQSGVTLEAAVEVLLQMWVRGEIDITFGSEVKNE